MGRFAFWAGSNEDTVVAGGAFTSMLSGISPLACSTDVHYDLRQITEAGFDMTPVAAELVALGALGLKMILCLSFGNLDGSSDPITHAGSGSAGDISDATKWARVLSRLDALDLSHVSFFYFDEVQPTARTLWLDRSRWLAEHYTPGIICMATPQALDPGYPGSYSYDFFGYCDCIGLDYYLDFFYTQVPPAFLIEEGPWKYLFYIDEIKAFLQPSQSIWVTIQLSMTNPVGATVANPTASVDVQIRRMLALNELIWAVAFNDVRVSGVLAFLWSPATSALLQYPASQLFDVTDPHYNADIRARTIRKAQEYISLGGGGASPASASLPSGGVPYYAGTYYAEGIGDGAITGSVKKYALLVDWTNSGVFSGAYVNVSDYLLDLQCDRGRHVANPLFGRSEAGTLKAVLDNRSGIFSRNNSASALYGSLDASSPVQWITSLGKRWTGNLVNLTPSRMRGLPVVTLEASGVFVNIAGKKVSPAADAGSLEGTIIGKILDAAGWPSAARSIDAGQSTTSRWFVVDLDAMVASRQIEETGLGFLREDPAGNIVYEDRNHRVTGARLFSQATYSDAPGATYPYLTITPQDPRPYVVNEVIATVSPYTVDGLTVLWTLQETPSLAPGQSRTWYAIYPNSVSASTSAYVDAWTTPVVGTDVFQSGVSNSDIGIAVVKEAQRMKITITNNHVSNTASITTLQARGTPVRKLTDATVASEDVTSQTAHGLKTYRTPSTWLQSTSQAQSYADTIVAFHKGIRTLADLRFLANMTDHIFNEVLTREISDRVTIVAGEERTALGINGDFFVERVQDHYDVQNARYEVIISLSQVGAETTAPPAWILGTNTLDVDTILGF